MFFVWKQNWLKLSNLKSNSVDKDLVKHSTFHLYCLDSKILWILFENHLEYISKNPLKSFKNNNKLSSYFRQT